MEFKAHIGIDCSNLTKSIDFFQLCGFDLAFINEESKSACLENTRFEINLFERPEFLGYSALLTGLRCLHLGFQLPSVSDLEFMRERLRKTYTVQSISARADGDTCFFATAPDELRVEFFTGTHHLMRGKYAKSK